MGLDTYKVIYGVDLRKHLDDVNDSLADRIDPKGINVVELTMLHTHSDGVSIRLSLLTKLINDEQGNHIFLEMPLSTYSNISHDYIVDTSTN